MARKKPKAKIIKIPWEPQPRQLKFLEACGLAYPFIGGSPTKPQARIIGYGGAAGGGKSDTLLLTGIIAGFTIPGITVGYFRREYPDLEGPGGAIMRSHEILGEQAYWNGGLRRWTLPNGSILQFCHAKHEDDIYGYQSLQFDIILIDESTQFTRFMYRYLLTRNRATKAGMIPFMAMGTNPGHVGHEWFRREFVKAGPFEEVNDVEVEPGRFETHIFIPAKLADNRILEYRDPGYRKTLESMPEETRRMLLDGDFDVFAGQAFSEFRPEIHLIKPFPIPAHWKRWIGHDPGYSDPFAFYWFTTDHDGNVYAYREYTRDPNEEKITYSDQGAGVHKLSIVGGEVGRPEIDEETGEIKKEKIDYVVCGMDAFNRHPETGKSIIDYFREGGMPFGCVQSIHGQNSRALRKGTLHEYLKWQEDKNTGKTTAKLKIFTSCKKLIEALPSLVVDDKDPEKVADSPLDHWYDALTYGICAWHSRESVIPYKEEKPRHIAYKDKLAKKHRHLKAVNW